MALEGADRGLSRDGEVSSEGRSSDVLEPRHAIFDAIDARDLEQIERLIKSGVDINEYTLDKGSPLIYAVTVDHYDVIESLIANGAEVNREVYVRDDGYDGDGRAEGELVTAVTTAIELGRGDTVELLCKHGAELKDIDRYLVYSAAMKHYSMMETCVLMGADVNAHYDEYYQDGCTCGHDCKYERERVPAISTALGFTVNYGSVEGTKFLLEHGAKQSDGSLIGAAYQHKEFEILELLARYWDKGKLHFKYPVASKAAYEGHLPLAKRLIEIGCDINSWGYDKFSDESRFDSDPEFTESLRHPFDHEPIYEFETVLIIAVACEADIDYIRWLLQHGADVKYRCQGYDVLRKGYYMREGSSAINIAAVRGRDDVVRLLLDYGADLLDIREEADREKYRLLCQHRPVRSLRQLAAQTITRYQVDTSSVPISTDPEEIARIERLMSNARSSHI